MKSKNLGIPINQEEVYYYLKDIRKIKVMSPEREKTLAIKMKSDNISEFEKKQIEEFSNVTDLSLNKINCFQRYIHFLFFFSRTLESSL